MKSIRPTFVLLVTILFWMSSELSAAPLESLSFQEALEKAEENALVKNEYSIAEKYYRQREGELWRRLYLPALTFQVTESDSGVTGSDPLTTREATIDYNLYAGGRDRASYQSARFAGSAEFQGRKLSLKELRLFVAETYLKLTNSAKRMESQNLSVEQARKQLQNAKLRSEIGLRAELEVLQANVAFEEEKLRFREEKNRQEELAQTLSDLIREEVSPETLVSISEAMIDEFPPLPYFQSYAETNHAGLKQAKDELNKFRQDVMMQQSVHWPEIFLSAGYSESESPDADTTSTSVGLNMIYRFGGHKASLSQTKSNGSIDEKYYDYGITFFDYSDQTATAESVLLQARIKEARAARNLTELQEEKRREINNLYNDLQTARLRQDVAVLLVNKNTTELEAYQKAYGVGTIRFDELLDRQTALNRSRLEEISTRVALKISWINLLAATGLPIKET